MASHLRRWQQRGGVGGNDVLHVEILEKALDARDDACLRAWCDAHVVQGGEKELEVALSDAIDGLALAVEVAHKVVDIAAVACCGVGRESFLDAKVSLKSLLYFIDVVDSW